MKTVTPEALADAYCKLYTGEDYGKEHRPEMVCILNNWLRRYEADPGKALSAVNWYGKATRALFTALGLKMPRTKTAMLQELSN